MDSSWNGAHESRRTLTYVYLDCIKRGQLWPLWPLERKQEGQAMFFYFFLCLKGHGPIPLSLNTPLTTNEVYILLLSLYNSIAIRIHEQTPPSRTWGCVNVRVHVRVHKRVHERVHERVYMCTCVRTCLRTCVRLCVHVRVCVCLLNFVKIVDLRRIWRHKHPHTSGFMPGFITARLTSAGKARFERRAREGNIPVCRCPAVCGHLTHGPGTTNWRGSWQRLMFRDN